MCPTENENEHLDDTFTWEGYRLSQPARLLAVLKLNFHRRFFRFAWKQMYVTVRSPDVVHCGSNTFDYGLA